MASMGISHYFAARQDLRDADQARSQQQQDDSVFYLRRAEVNARLAEVGLGVDVMLEEMPEPQRSAWQLAASGSDPVLIQHADLVTVLSALECLSELGDPDERSRARALADRLAPRPQRAAATDNDKPLGEIHT